MTSEELKNIFYSGYDAAPDWLILDELEFLLNKDGLCYKVEKICNVKEYKRLIGGVKAVEGSGRQYKGHMALKIIAQQFLKQINKASFTERHFLGAHPDVISADKSLIIECGTTSPEVILLFLREPQVKRVAILPYSYTGEKKLRMHIFSRGPNFRKFMLLRVKKLKKVFESARK